jgi:hypothetical protein
MEWITATTASSIGSIMDRSREDRTMLGEDEINFVVHLVSQSDVGWSFFKYVRNQGKKKDKPITDEYYIIAIWNSLTLNQDI